MTRKRRAELAAAHSEIVRAVVAQLRRFVPWRWDTDDLHGYGQLALLKALDEYKPGRSRKIEGYLKCKVRFGILDSLRAVDHCRRKGGVPRFAVLEAVPPEIRQVPAQQDREVLREETLRAVRRLPARLRSVVLLRYREEKTMAEIGEQLGLSQARVSQLHREAMLQLRQMLEVSG